MAEHLIRRRLERGLVRAHAARELGVTREALSAWEAGREPPDHFWPKIVGFLGYDPSPPPISSGERLSAARRRAGMTIKQVAGIVGCNRESFSNWECDLSQPAGVYLDRLTLVLGPF